MSTQAVDTVEPSGEWEFDEEVARSFDDMLERSIPQYETMRRGVFDWQKAFMPRQDGHLLDLGTSRGESVARAVEHFGNRTEFTLVEVSDPMLEQVRDRFGDYQNIYIKDCDLTTRFPNVPSDVVQSILTLQFTPINYRQQLIQSCYDCLRDGGAFIFVEKVLGQGAQLDNLQDTFYHALKRDNGYSYEDIDAKSDSLEGVLVPVTADWNEEMLREAGFSHVDCFWRWMKFAGWIAVK
jgi:tRNA (cmo5U34)-methyltransferase